MIWITCFHTHLYLTNICFFAETERLLQTFQRSDQYYPVIELQDSLTTTFLEALNDKLRYLKLQDKHIIMLGDRKTLTLAKKHFHFHQTLYVKNEKSLQKTYSFVTERIKLLQIDPHHSAITYGQRIVLLGRPGCGKHRVGKWLAEKLNICLGRVWLYCKILHFLIYRCYSFRCWFGSTTWA